MTWLDRRLRRFGGRFRIPEVRGQNRSAGGARRARGRAVRLHAARPQPFTRKPVRARRIEAVSRKPAFSTARREGALSSETFDSAWWTEPVRRRSTTPGRSPQPVEARARPAVEGVDVGPGPARTRSGLPAGRRGSGRDHPTAGHRPGLRAAARHTGGETLMMPAPVSEQRSSSHLIVRPREVTEEGLCTESALGAGRSVRLRGRQAR